MKTKSDEIWGRRKQRVKGIIGRPVFSLAYSLVLPNIHSFQLSIMLQLPDFLVEILD